MRIAVFDLDGTLSRRDLYLAFLAAAVRRFGPARPFRSAMLPVLTARFFLRGIRNDQLKEAFLDAILGGRPRERLDELAADFAQHAAEREIKPAALEALRHHRRAGDALLLASASLDLYVGPIAQRLGFDATAATRVAWTPEERIAGGLDGPNLRGEAKLAAVRTMIAERFPDAREIVAYSDHESDLPLLAAADTAIAVDPTRALRRIARERGWRVVEWGLAGARAVPAPFAPRAGQGT
jgi:phosphatidylglycerophosphatase C